MRRLLIRVSTLIRSHTAVILKVKKKKKKLKSRVSSLLKNQMLIVNEDFVSCFCRLQGRSILYINYEYNDVNLCIALCIEVM